MEICDKYTKINFVLDKPYAKTYNELTAVQQKRIDTRQMQCRMTYINVFLYAADVQL